MYLHTGGEGTPGKNTEFITPKTYFQLVVEGLLVTPHSARFFSPNQIIIVVAV